MGQKDLGINSDADFKNLFGYDLMSFSPGSGGSGGGGGKPGLSESEQEKQEKEKEGKPAGITDAKNTASAFTVYGDGAAKWLQKNSPTLYTYATKGIANVRDWASKIFQGGQILFDKVSKGDFGFFKDWFQEDKVGAVAGGLLIGGVAVLGGVVLGSVIGGISGMVAAAGGAGALLTAVSLPTLVATMWKGVSYLYDINLNETDISIETQINGAITEFYGQAGDSLGTALAGFVVGSTTRGVPKIKIYGKEIAVLYACLKEEGDTDEIGEEILQALTNMVHAGLKAAQVIGFKLTFLNVRKWIRKNVKTGIPQIDNIIKNWGVNGGQPWVLSDKIEEQIEKIEDKNIENFMENFVDSFFDGLGDFAEVIR